MATEIIVRVRGGLVDSVENVPAGHVVVVFDYDGEAGEWPGGEECWKSEWEG
jgi:hypothetical protein